MLGRGSQYSLVTALVFGLVEQTVDRFDKGLGLVKRAGDKGADAQA